MDDQLRIRGNKMTTTTDRLLDWIGPFEGLYSLSESSQEELLQFLENQNINMENPQDVQTVSDFVASLQRSQAAAILGHKGGSSTSEAKQAAVRENGKRGGRPRRQE